MRKEDQQEDQKPKFEKQIGYDEIALTRKEIIELRGYEKEKKDEKNGRR